MPQAYDCYAQMPHHKPLSNTTIMVENWGETKIFHSLCVTIDLIRWNKSAKSKTKSRDAQTNLATKHARILQCRNNTGQSNKQQAYNIQSHSLTIQNIRDDHHFLLTCGSLSCFAKFGVSHLRLSQIAAPGGKKSSQLFSVQWMAYLQWTKRSCTGWITFRLRRTSISSSSSSGFLFPYGWMNIFFDFLASPVCKVSAVRSAMDTKIIWRGLSGKLRWYSFFSAKI